MDTEIGKRVAATHTAEEVGYVFVPEKAQQLVTAEQEARQAQEQEVGDICVCVCV